MLCLPLLVAAAVAAHYAPPVVAVAALADAHVFRADEQSRQRVFHTDCRMPCGWMATDGLGNFVAEGQVRSDGSVQLSAENFPVGWYRFEFSRPGINDTTAAVLRSPSSSAAAWPPRDTPVAIDTAQSWLQPCDLDTQTIVSKLAAAAGCGYTRDRLRWSDLEPSRGTFAPPGSTCYDNATQAARAAGVRVLDVFHATPSWAINATVDAQDGCDASGIEMPRDLRDVFNWAKWLARRFGPVESSATAAEVYAPEEQPLVSAFEPWNEGNIAAFGGQTTDQRDSHQKAAFLGFRSAAPAGVLISNNVIASAGSNLTSEMTTENHVRPYYQTYNIHSYDPVERYVEIFSAARRLTRLHPTSPLWLTECGVHLPAKTAAPWSDMTPSDDLRQAQFVAQSYAVSLYAGVDKHFFFVLSNYLERGLQYGLLRHDRTPRLGYSALAAVGYFFPNATALGKLSVSKIAPTPRARQEDRTLLLPDAPAYAMRAQPGGGKACDVLVLYCPLHVGADISQTQQCAVPQMLLKAVDRHKNAAVFDMLGRDLPGGLPKNVSGSSLFVVLPTGATDEMHLIPPPDAKMQRTAPAAAPSTQTDSIDVQSSAHDSEKPSNVILQAVFPYRDNQIGVNVDAHELNATAGVHTPVPLYLYNFGTSVQKGTLVATAAPSMTVTPSQWDDIEIAPGGRERVVVKIAPPGGRSAVDGDPGSVELKGTFASPDRQDQSIQEEQEASLFFRVVPNLDTLQPAVRTACAGASDPRSWSHNVPTGAQMQVSATRAGCVRFDFQFGASVADAWAYPQLTFNASDGAPTGTDGVRYTLIAPPNTNVKAMNLIFFDMAGSQWSAKTRADISNPKPQELTVLLKDAMWDHQGAPPADPSSPITAEKVLKIGVGLNLENSGSNASMEVCELSWVRF